MEIKKYANKEHYTADDFFDIVRLLRDPVDGCPWDKQQTHESIRHNFLEETYEACDAIDKKDSELLCEELGDVLLQVALHAEIERQGGGFDVGDVIDGICRKLVVRHPHIFGEATAATSDEVLTTWEAIKRKTKGQKAGSQAIDDVPAALPALARSQKVQKRAADAGFDYPDTQGALSDLHSEIVELDTAVRENTNVAEELGDVIFAAVNVARFCGIDAEQAAEAACNKFVCRYKTVETAAQAKGIDMKCSGIDILNELWKYSKEQNNGKEIQKHD